MMRIFARLAPIVVLLASVAVGCAGGGHAASTVPSTATSASAHTGTASVTFSFTIPTPPPGLAASARAKKYVSSNTRSATLVVTPAGGTPQPTINLTCYYYYGCSSTVLAPTGLVTFAVTLYDNYNGTGNVLSQGSLQATILANQTNSLVVTFNPVLNHVVLGSVPTFVAGIPTSAPLTYYAYDPSGYPIIGPGQYTDANGNPIAITFTSSDTAGHVAINSSPIPAPSGTVTYAQSLLVTYDGSPPRGNYSVAIAAAVPNVTPSASATANVTVQGQYANYAPFTTAAYTVTSPALVGSRVYYGLRRYVSPNYVDSLGYYDTSNGTLGETPLPRSTSNPIAVAAPGDGNAWVLTQGNGSQGTGTIDRVTPAGVFTEFPLPSNFTLSTYSGYSSAAMLVGPDGNLWVAGYVTNGSNNVAAFVKTTTSGTMTTYPLSANSTNVVNFTSAPGGPLYYFTSANGLRFGSITTAGVSTDVPYTGSVSPYYYVMLYGGDGNIHVGGYKLTTTGATLANDYTNPSFVLPDGRLVGGYIMSSSGALLSNIYTTSFASNATCNTTARSFVIGPDGNFYCVNGSGVTKFIW